MIHVGIDPGKQGAMAILGPGGSVQVFKHPLVQAPKERADYDLGQVICRLMMLRSVHEPVLVAIERQHAMPKAGAIAAFERGRTEGWVWAMHALRVPYVRVRAREWQRDLGLVRPPSGDAPDQKLVASLWDSKEASIKRATERFGPGILVRSKRARVPDDGIADALNLADWCRLYGSRHPASQFEPCV